MNIDTEDGLVLEEITFPGGNSIRLRAVSPSGEERVFNYPVHENGMVGLSAEYADLYGDGGPFPIWPNHLAAASWEARQQPLPIGGGPRRNAPARPRSGSRSLDHATQAGLIDLAHFATGSR